MHDQTELGSELAFKMTRRQDMMTIGYGSILLSVVPPFQLLYYRFDFTIRKGLVPNLQAFLNEVNTT